MFTSMWIYYAILVALYVLSWPYLAQAQFTVSGIVSGLTGGTVVLLDNNRSPFSILTNEPFTFSTQLGPNAGYNVTVQTQPTAQTCAVHNGIGSVGNSNVNGVVVNCYPLYQWSSMGPMD
jgi:hypothetical protein